MGKVFTCTAIVLLMLFTAALILAPPAKAAPTPWTSGTGTLYLVDAGATSTTPITLLTDSGIALNHVTTGPPSNFFVGTLTYTMPPGTTPTTVDISVILGPDDPTAYHIVGTNLSAKASFGWYPDPNDLNAKKVPKVKWGLGIRGQIQGTPAGSFEGVFFNY